MTRQQREGRTISSHLSLFLARARRGPGQLAGVWKKAKKGLTGAGEKAKKYLAGVARARSWAKMGEKQKRLTVAVLLFFILFCLAQLVLWLASFPEEALHRPTATLVFDRKGRLLRAFTSVDEKWRFQTPLEQISPELQKFLVFYEDRWFFWHPGVNPFSFLRAAYQNLRAKTIVAGGSTISMQIARMMEPKPRTWSAKIREIF